MVGVARPAHESDTRLRAARTARGLTLQEVADLAGVTRGVIQSWESRKKTPTSENALKVAEAMDLDMEDLFHDFGIRRVPRGEEL